MKGYIAEVLGFLTCIGVIYAAPDIALTLIVVSLPIIAIITGVSVWYLRSVYRKQPTPRSRFFGMLVGISARSWIGALWVGYLVIGRVLDRMSHDGLPVITVPVPPPNISSPISGLVVAYLMTPPIFYAVNVWRVRRTAGDTGTALEREDGLDREDPAQP